MCCLDIVWMIVPPGSAHSFWILVIWDDIVVGELFLADPADAALFSDLPVHQFSGFPRGIAVPDVLAGGADLRPAELLVLRAGDWEGSPVRSRKAIYELGRIRWNGVSWQVSSGGG